MSTVQRIILSMGFAGLAFLVLYPQKIATSSNGSWAEGEKIRIGHEFIWGTDYGLILPSKNGGVLFAEDIDKEKRSELVRRWGAFYAPVRIDYQLTKHECLAVVFVTAFFFFLASLLPTREARHSDD